MLEQFFDTHLPAPHRSQLTGVFGPIDRVPDARTPGQVAAARGLTADRLSQLTGLAPGRVATALAGTTDLEAAGRVAAALDAELPELDARPALAVQIVHARWSQQLTVSALADRVGVNRSTIFTWETGRATPRPVQCAALLQALPLDPSALAPTLELARWEVAVVAGRRPEPAPDPSLGAVGAGRAVRRQRLRLGLTVAQFAVRLRCSTSLVTSWESGAYLPSADMASRLVELTGCEPKVFRVPSNRAGRLPQLLRHRRAALGLTQQQLADRLQVAPSSVTSWECGRWVPQQDRWARIADVLRVTPSTMAQACRSGTAATASVVE